MVEQSSFSAASRRNFLTTSAAATSLAASLSKVPAVHAAGDDTIKVGLIGCGGRGTGAATEALQADSNVKLVAMADMFDERLKASLRLLERQESLKGKVDVPIEARFVGFEAYQQVINSDVDVVLLTTPPHFRPIHLKAAIEAGKHVFAEKPCAVDSPGVHSVLKSCELAKKKNLAVVSGLCLRYHQPYRAAMQRIHDGEIGEIHTLFANDYRGPIWVKPRRQEWTDMHWQMHNWYYFTWLSGDFNVEQHVHNLDVCAWAMKDQYPVRAIGMGGREVRKGSEYGNIFDHHSVVYEYPNGSKLVSNTRQIDGCKSDISVELHGSRGRAILTERTSGVRIISGAEWTYQGEEKSCYQIEHDELFASIVPASRLTMVSTWPRVV